MIKTLHKTRTERGTVRLVERANTTHPYVVILDVAGDHVGFEPYTNYAEAVATFATLSGKLDQPADVETTVTETAAGGAA